MGSDSSWVLERVPSFQKAEEKVRAMPSSFRSYIRFFPIKKIGIIFGFGSKERPFSKVFGDWKSEGKSCNHGFVNWG